MVAVWLGMLQLLVGDVVALCPFVDVDVLGERMS